METTTPIADPAHRANSSLDAALADAHSRYAAARPRSAEIHAKARASLAGGNTRSVLFYAPFPTAMARGEAARLYDMDGREYIDALGEYTAGLFGHSEARIITAVKAALDGGINLANLDANLKKLVLDNGELTALNLEASVKDLKIADQFKVSGKLAVDYNKTATKTTLTGSAEINSFALNLGDTSSITVTKGSIDFSALNGKLETASLAINSAKISAGEQLTINMASGSVDLVQENGTTKSLKVKAALSASTVGPLSITAANLDLDRVFRFQEPFPADDVDNQLE
jgi:hypothetical protein